ncbi:MAG: CoA transferase [Gemmatimonadota bacterium]|nr:CoA transferase [Gemmatimonadota bacterium]MDH3423261.1 CoA transferase [Gemmatimonadota bacterium]
MTAPLSDIRVCDLTQNLAGPYCSQILADLGATVIKIEPPGGDMARAWGPPFWGSGSALFLSVNRGKRSIVLDLKTEAGMDVLRRIARESDVFMQASRRGVAQRLGFDYDAIRAVRPNVVYASVSAFGTEGPRKNEPGYDPLIQAYTGLMSTTGHPGMPPTRVGGAVVDYGTGMWTALAVLAALRKRDQTGEGSEVDTALLDTSLGWISYHLTGYMATGQVPGPMGSGVPAIAPYEAFPTSDGHVMISAGNDALFARLCSALGIEELVADPRFLTNPLRSSNHDELIPLIEEHTKVLTTAQLLELGTTYSVPCSAIHDVAQVVADPQVEASAMFVAAPNAEVDDYRDLSLPLRMDGERPRDQKPPPRQGEHTKQVLAELGFGEDEIRALIDSGAAEAR